jgi:uncharacterized membrane protein YgcG
MLNVWKYSLSILIISLLSASVFAPGAQAEITYPADSNIFIVDDVDVLSLDEKRDINQVSDDLEFDTGTALVVVTINSTMNYTTGNDTNMSLGDYAVDLFNEWKIGDQDYRDGLLLLIATNQSGDGYDWAYAGGEHWWEYWYVLEEWEEDLPDTVFTDLNNSNWSSAILPMVTSLSNDVEEFWFENPGIEPFENTNDDPFNEDWYNPPRLNGEENDVQSSDLGDGLFSIVACLGCLGVFGAIGFFIFRGASSGSSGVSMQRNYGNNVWWRNNNEHYPGGQGGYQQNNYYMGNDSNNSNSPPPSRQSSSSRSSGGSSRSSGGSSRSSGGSSRSSGGSSRSSGGSSRSSGGSSRGGGSRGRSGGGRRR